MLLLREKLVEQNKTHELSKMDKDITNITMKAQREQLKVQELKEKLEESVTEKEDDTSEKNKFALKRDNSYFNFQTNGDREKELAAKCLRLILQGRLPPSPPALKVGTDEEKFVAQNCLYFLIHKCIHLFWVLKRAVS